MNKADRQQFNEHLARIGHKMIDACEKIVDTVSAGLDKSQDRHAPAHVARRQIANIMGVSQFCANKTCRRSHCCRGEPLHCLQAVAPLLPAEAFAAVLENKRASPRRRPIRPLGQRP